MTGPGPVRPSPTLPKVTDEEPTNPGAPAVHGWVRGVVAEAEHALKRAGVWALIAIVLSAGATGFFATRALANEIKEKVDAGIGATVPVLAQQVAINREEIAAIKKERAESNAQHRKDIAELQTDVRSLYKAMMTGRPSPRLEQPLDGGQ